MKNLKYLTISNSLFFLTFNLINSFGVAILFEKYPQSYIYAIGPFALTRLLYALLLPFLAPVIGKFGIRNSIILGLFFLFLSNLSIVFIDSFQFFLLVWIFLISLCFSFYFLPMTIYTSKFTSAKNRSSNMSFMYSGMILMSAMAPLISGKILLESSIQVFAIFLATIILIGIIPLFKLKNITFEYTGKITSLLKVNKALIRASWIESCHFATRNIGIFWTLFIFLFLNQDFRKFGIILTGITLFSGVINLFLGKYMNQHNRKHALRIQSVLSPLSWIFRLGATTTIGIFFADAFHNLNGFLRESSVETTAYDLINRGNHHQALDEKIVTREIIINLAIFVSLCLGILLATLFGIKASFILGVIISLGFLFI